MLLFSGLQPSSAPLYATRDAVATRPLHLSGVNGYFGSLDAANDASASASAVTKE